MIKTVVCCWESRFHWDSLAALSSQWSLLKIVSAVVCVHTCVFMCVMCWSVCGFHFYWTFYLFLIPALSLYSMATMTFISFFIYFLQQPCWRISLRVYTTLSLMWTVCAVCPCHSFYCHVFARIHSWFCGFFFSLLFLMCSYVYYLFLPYEACICIHMHTRIYIYILFSRCFLI